MDMVTVAKMFYNEMLSKGHSKEGKSKIHKDNSKS